MKDKFEWLEKKTPRSIEQLKLWGENPRLNPDEPHSTVADFAEDIIADENDKKHFFDLLRSIAVEYIPADPIVVWKEMDNRFYVAEGNRRVLALKLLKDPEKAPKSIRAYVRRVSENRTENYDKIKVCVAPSFEAVEWYINQRNSTSSLQQPWSRIQQQRWIERLYKQYGNDIPTLLAKTSMSIADLEGYIRNLRLIDLIKTEEVKNALTDKEYKDATSHKFPITILERFFNNTQVKEKWGVEVDGLEFRLKNKEGFLKAYAQLIKNIVSDKPTVKIDTRTITTDLNDILASLPQVDLRHNDLYIVGIEDTNNSKGPKEEQEERPNIKSKKPTTKGDPNRTKLISSELTLHTTDYRLLGIFNELKELSINKYKNATAASIRIFLDLSVLNWLNTENKVVDLQKKYSSNLRDIVLKNRLTFIEEELSGKNKKAASIISKLLNPANELSLDVLNGYQHSADTCFLNKQFLNRFWDFLFPLFEVLLDIKDNSLQDE